MIEPNIVDFLFNDDVNLNGVVYILDDNAVDDEANHHAQPVRNENYVEVTVPQYTVSEFKNHFRMSRMAVEQLIGLVSNHLPDKHSVPIEKQVLFSIWLLAKQESFLAVGDRFNLLVNNPALLTPQQHLLGDAAYPLLDNLLKPYRDNGHLTEVQIRFNEVMSSIRSMIERCFGLLKGKWRRLKYLDMSLADKLPQVILAACILHNFILIIDNDADNQNDNGHNGDDIGIQHAEFYEEDVGRNAEIKRDYIASLL
ncbi:hypothetical protein PPYR_02266 [Photinus pyralis]|uniref:DDE Tnp4 domain-containing protein n=1 Tax=Photinus pyralis TaxID=7054 RepID=A0A5N4B6V1_PHOPY|nr:hypothetical protein PPYR_02266 [Photinus pyralis]